MPPYTPVKSKAQSRALFAAARRGEISLDDAKGKTRAADFSSLPERTTRTPRTSRVSRTPLKRGKRGRTAPRRPAHHR
jgi:hypothetical protein